VAVLLVARAHAGVPFLSGGFVGVDVFFVLSGFLITGILVAEFAERRAISLPRFYLRRARRILPAAMLTLVVTDIAPITCSISSGRARPSATASGRRSSRPTFISPGRLELAPEVRLAFRRQLFS
jgi:peptidoglycan/LPS O-acetylase OafA/YrhL